MGKKTRNASRHIPSLFTLINMFLGFLAIISIFEGLYLRAGYLIIIAGIFDVLDGKVARKFSGSSQFGGELDSLADLVSFCMAPSLLIWALYAQDLHPVMGALIGGMPLYFGALRLARFNLETGPVSKQFFTGLPSPISALSIVALVFYYNDHGGHASAAKVVLPMVMVISFLMVSKIRYRKFPAFSFHHGLSNSIYLVAAIILLLSLFIFGGQALLPAAILYLLSGVVRLLMRTDLHADLHSVEEEV